MTKEEFDTWKQDFITVEILTHIQALRSAAVNAATDPTILLQAHTAALHARYVGLIEGFDAVLNVSFEDDKQDEVIDSHDD